MNKEFGFLLIDKPAGITSHDVVYHVRRATGEKRVGHAGTLDPFATGLLILAVGRQATREISRFVGLDKIYEATFILGATTPSLDPETPKEPAPIPTDISETTVQEALRALTGPLEQIPPMYSAIKVKGRKLYELARKGETIEVKPRSVRVYAFKLISFEHKNDYIRLNVRVNVSSGTYIRSLARDLGEQLGTKGYVEQLRRVSTGPFTIEEAVELKELTPETWKTSLQSAENLLSRIPSPSPTA